MFSPLFLILFLFLFLILILILSLVLFLFLSSLFFSLFLLLYSSSLCIFVRDRLVGAAAKVHPRAFGIGVVAPVASFGILLTYNVIMAWCWVMLFYSFYPSVLSLSLSLSLSLFLSLYTLSYLSIPLSLPPPPPPPPPQRTLPWGTTLESTATFFTQTVQGQDPANACQVSLECGIGLPHWPLVLGLAVQYGLVFLACFKGVELVSKIVWFTV